MADRQGVTNTIQNFTQRTIKMPEYTIERKNEYISINSKHGTFTVSEDLFNSSGKLSGVIDYSLNACTLKLKNGISLSLNDNNDISKTGDAQVEISGVGDSVFISAHNADYLGINSKNGKQENIFLAVDDSNVKLFKDANDAAHPRVPIGYLEIQ